MSFVPLFALWSALPWLVNAFSFTPNTPTQCDDLKISWTALQTFSVPRNNQRTGSFSTPLQFNATDKIVLTMSDSTGFGAGGSTEILTVGASLGGSCDTSPENLGFTFRADEAQLQQCGAYIFSQYIESGAVAPVTISGTIPGGDSFELHPPINRKTFTWTANVFNGTQIIFSMTDANFRQGGSFLNTVAVSGDSSCITPDSPSSTTNAAATPTSSGPGESSAPATPRSSTGAIAGSVLGALIFLAVLITLGLFFLRQRQEKKKTMMAGGSEFRRTSRPLDSQLDLTYDPRQNTNAPPYNGPPYMSPSNSATPATSLYGHEHQAMQGSPQLPTHYQPHSPFLSSRSDNENPFSEPSPSAEVNPFMDQGSGSDAVSAGQRKSGMSGFTGYKPSRYVLHTDAEDDDLPVNADGVVELPPQYSASRAPRSNIPP
ncbi:hypothetical protein C8R43DRAFT_1029766 [Mycena crocata]|nr:hypothetical protein C8R43DRAFT_1029766 [Mycena crocata]